MENKIKEPVKIKEDPEAVVKRLEEENQQLRALAEKAINENQILRATVKALSNLI